jgi:hypothetical protein
MTSVYYFLSLVAIFVIIFWFVANDRVPPDRPTKGLLAMKLEANATESEDSGKKNPKADTLLPR